MGIQIPADYRPSETEPFMNERQREYFRRKLNGWKEEISRKAARPSRISRPKPSPHADLADRASTEAERQLELRTRDRQRKLIAQDRRGAAPDRGRLLRLLRGNRRADLPQAAGREADRHAVDRGAGAA